MDTQNDSADGGSPVPSLARLGGYQRQRPTMLLALTSPLRGLAFLLKNRPLWRIVATPLLINLVIFAIVGVVLMFTWGGVNDSIHDLILGGLENPEPTVWYQWFRYVGIGALSVLLSLLVAVLSIAVYAIGFLVGAKALTAPFLDVLSEHVEMLARQVKLKEEAFSLSVILGDASRAILGELKKLGMLVGVFLASLLLLLIPLVGPVAQATVMGVYTVWWLGMDFLDHPMGRRHVDLRRKLGFARSRPLPVMSFGLGVLAVTSVPVLNVLAAPFLTVGGTLLWLDMGGWEEFGDVQEVETAAGEAADEGSAA